MKDFLLKVFLLKKPNWRSAEKKRNCRTSRRLKSFLPSSVALFNFTSSFKSEIFMHYCCSLLISGIHFYSHSLRKESARMSQVLLADSVDRLTSLYHSFLSESALKLYLYQKKISQWTLCEKWRHSYQNCRRYGRKSWDCYGTPNLSWDTRYTAKPLSIICQRKVPVTFVPTGCVTGNWQRVSDWHRLVLWFPMKTRKETKKIIAFSEYERCKSSSFSN